MATKIKRIYTDIQNHKNALLINDTLPTKEDTKCEFCHKEIKDRYRYTQVFNRVGVSQKFMSFVCPDCIHKASNIGSVYYYDNKSRLLWQIPRADYEEIVEKYDRKNPHSIKSKISAAIVPITTYLVPKPEPKIITLIRKENIWTTVSE
jgi:hypothetical protein